MNKTWPLVIEDRYGSQRQWLSVYAVLALVFAVALGLSVWTLFYSRSVIADALQSGLVAALATALGASPVLLSQHLSVRIQDTLFGFGAGVMLAACAFSLIVPGLEAAQSAGIWGGGTWAASAVMGLAILLGGACLLATDHLLPHEHFIKGCEGLNIHQLRRTWLFVFAIALHNLPEGLAIGVAYAGDNMAHADALALGVAIQDVPEGLVVATSLFAAGYHRSFAVILGVSTGLIEPLAAVVGAAIASHSSALLPWGLGFAAGAMLFVISHEIIPESHRKGHEALATTGLMIGFVLMMMLDTALA